MRAFFSTHSKSGIYEWVSNDIIDILGYNPKDLMNTTAYDYFYPEDLRRIVKSHIKSDFGQYTQKVT